jgi:gliding motility-associated-like protein
MPVPINPTICRGDSIALFLANPEPGVAYRWISPQIPTLDARIAQLRVAPTANTSYTLTAQRGNCPAVSVTTTINVIQPADVTVPAAQRLCPGQNITLTATGSAAPGVNQSFLWTWNNGQSSSAGPTVTVNNLRQTTVFNMIYTWGQNCGRITKSVVVTVDPVPVINAFSYNPPEAPAEGVPLGNSLTIGAITTPPSPGGVTYLWKANGEDIPGTGSSVTHKPVKNPTTYTLTIRTANGCEVTSVTPPIRVKLPEFDVPNAFTPDGDGTNDFFNVVFTGNLDIVEFRVWNRWGQLVYNNDDKANGWNGKIGSQEAPSEVYVYNIVLRFPDGQEFVRRGDVSLIR